MEFSSTPIKGLYVIRLHPFNDLRGQLLKPFNAFQYAANAPEKINTEIKEVWFTKSRKDVIRAMHLQVGALACEKIVSTLRGTVRDVILDIRKDSPTYGTVFDIDLSEDDPKALYIPVGCAHGYRVISEDSIVMYMSTQDHSAEDDVGIRYDSFGYDWGIAHPVVSEKDKHLPLFGSYVYEPAK